MNEVQCIRLSGWMGSVAAQLFSGPSRDVRLGSSPGSGWATRTFRDLSQSHSCVDLAVYLGLLSCWKVNLHPSLEVLRSLEQVLSWISLYFAPFIFPSILTSLPVPASEKHPHSMMLPPPCFTVEMVSSRHDAWQTCQRVQCRFHQTIES